MRRLEPFPTHNDCRHTNCVSMENRTKIIFHLNKRRTLSPSLDNHHLGQFHSRKEEIGSGTASSCLLSLDNLIPMRRLKADISSLCICSNFSAECCFFFLFEPSASSLGCSLLSNGFVMLVGGRTRGLALRFDLSILADDESMLNKSSIVLYWKYSGQSCSVRRPVQSCPLPDERVEFSIFHL